MGTDPSNAVGGVGALRLRRMGLGLGGLAIALVAMAGLLAVAPARFLVAVFRPGMDCAPPRNLLCADEAAGIAAVVGLGLFTAATLLLLAACALVLKHHLDHRERREAVPPPRATPASPAPGTRTEAPPAKRLAKAPLHKRLGAAVHASWRRWRGPKRGRRGRPPAQVPERGPAGDVHPGHGRFHERFRRPPT